MSDDKITIRTNNVPRDVLDASELTIKEQREFDYNDREYEYIVIGTFYA